MPINLVSFSFAGDSCSLQPMCQASRHCAVQSFIPVSSVQGSRGEKGEKGSAMHLRGKSLTGAAVVEGPPGPPGPVGPAGKKVGCFPSRNIVNPWLTIFNADC